MSSDDSMRDADVTNGENPDEANGQPDREQNPETESVPTGERQADENRQNDPPA